MQQEVIPMSVTTLFNSEDNNKRPVRSTWSGIQATAAVSVALLIAAFFVAVGCSKKSTNSSVNSENQNPSMQAFNSTPAAPVATQAASAPVAPTPKKSARKRAVNVTYSDKTSRISFLYPPRYSPEPRAERARIAARSPGRLVTVGDVFRPLPGGLLRS